MKVRCDTSLHHQSQSFHTPWWKYDGWKRAKCPHKSKCAGLLIVICCTHRLTVIFKLPVKLRNCFGNPDRGRAQSRVPEPSQRITGLAASMFTFRVWFSQKINYFFNRDWNFQKSFSNILQIFSPKNFDTFTIKTMPRPHKSIQALLAGVPFVYIALSYARQVGHAVHGLVQSGKQAQAIGLECSIFRIHHHMLKERIHRSA